MKIIFDGTEWHIEDSSKNLVEQAKEHGIFIPAPCYYKKEENGCCNGCIVVIDGQEAKACSTLPTDGMNIVFNRDDLIAKREHNLTNYVHGITPEMEEACSHTSHSDDACGCGGNCDCGGNCGCGGH